LLRPNRFVSLSLSSFCFKYCRYYYVYSPWFFGQNKSNFAILFFFFFFSLSSFSYVIVVEHDLSVLDYLSDFICCLYGKPGAYGVVTLPFSVREGINIFLSGFVPTENLRFREESLTFKVYIIYLLLPIYGI
jgi:hypothetical protein